MSLHQKRFLERLQWPLWSIVLAVTILLLRSGSEQNGSFGISLETPVHAHPTPVPTPYVTAEPELKDSVYFRKDGQNVNGQTFEVYWEPNKNAAFYRGKAGITVPGPVEYELDTSHWWIGPEEWRFASSAGQGYPVDYCYSIVHSSFPSLNTVILLEQLPLTIVYRVKVEDDEQYGGNNPPSRTNCPIKNVPGSKDETAEHEVRVRVLPPCDCEVSFSGERVFKGSSETSDLIITNTGSSNSCTFSWSISVDPAYPEYQDTITFSPASGITGPIAGGQSSAPIPITYFPENTAPLEAIPVIVTAFPVTIPHLKCETSSEITVDCSSQVHERENITWDITAIVENFLSLTPLTMIPCPGDPTGNTAKVKFSGSREVKDCCDNNKYYQAGKTTLSLGLSAQACAKTGLLGKTIYETLTIPILGNLRVKSDIGVTVTGSLSFSGSFNQVKSLCIPEPCFGFSAGINASLSGDVGWNAQVKLDTAEILNFSISLISASISLGANLAYACDTEKLCGTVGLSPITVTGPTFNVLGFSASLGSVTVTPALSKSWCLEGPLIGP